ncbi:MAG: SAP domain-containing protein [Desulfuromonadaceae bacterium]|nr:SAP domain-containing protein [Desulfuromonadaceae bacterium]MDD2849290.1 SAP domain-containing protein [Desulfuromonadaceae bacterium]MDD4131917.1 SAP domain-containing protein [Desulfuromonadaceae bacterium]
MKMQEVKEIAKKKGVQTSKLNKGELIRAIQSEEGNISCFGIGKATECCQARCLWREDCN